MSAKESTIKPGETVELPGGAKLKFIGNSHKKMPAGAGVSPVVVEVEYEEDGKTEPDYYTVHVSEPDLKPVIDGWKWHDYIFKFVSYVYDESMDLKVTHDPDSKETDGLLTTKPDGI